MLERIGTFRRTLQDALAERRVESAYATGLFVDTLPDVYDLNYVRADRGAPASELAREADSLMEPFRHRKVIATTGGDASAGGFRKLGWIVSPHLVMAHRRGPDRVVDTSHVVEVSFEDVAPVRAAVSEADYGDNTELAEHLNEAKRRVAAAVPMRWFAAYTDGRIAAYCELRSRGGVAQIEDVNTLAEFRGRGLGRALVQHALGEARRGHELVFLEALEDDWPNQLYAKLGFDVVGRYHHILLPASPLTRLRLRTPRLELRLPTVSELRALAEVARAGIHDPAEMPFETAWTDNAASASFVEDFVAYHLATLRDSRPERWRLELVAFLDGEPVGVQGIGAVEFPHQREVSTGSWLGEQWQRQGLGTEMRAAVLSLAFTGLGAQTAVSAAWEHNDSSLGVSRKLGYVEAGTRLSQPRGEPLVHRVLRLDRTAFRSPVPVELAGLEGLAPLFHR